MKILYSIIIIKYPESFCKMLNFLDITANIKTTQEPHILKYWIEGKLSPCIKEKNIKIIINNDTKKSKEKK